MTILKRADDPTLYWKTTFTAEERRQLASRGEAKPDGSYPIRNASDLENAIRSWGRGGSTASDKAWIIRRAKALGLESKIPDNWTKKRALSSKLIDAVVKNLPGDSDGDAMDFATVYAGIEAGEQTDEMMSELCEIWGALMQSVRTIRCDLEMSPDQKLAAIRGSVTQFVSMLNERAPDGLTEDMEKKLLAGFGKSRRPDNKGVSAMSALTKALGLPDNATEDQIAKAVAPLVAHLAKMSDRHEAYMNHPEATMPKGGKQAFKDMSPGERDDHIADNPIKKPKEEADEVVKFGAQEIRKSVVGPAHFAIFKAQAEEIEKLRDNEELTKFEKRAASELPNLPGLPIAKAKVLRAIGKMGQEDGAALTVMLKAGNEAMKLTMVEKGHGRGDTFAKASDEMDALVAAHMAKHNVTKAAAYDAMLKTERGRELYTEMDKPVARAA